jgi:hypothetical protein
VPFRPHPAHTPPSRFPLTYSLTVVARRSVAEVPVGVFVSTLSICTRCGAARTQGRLRRKFSLSPLPHTQTFVASTLVVDQRFRSIWDQLADRPFSSSKVPRSGTGNSFTATATVGHNPSCLSPSTSYGRSRSNAVSNKSAHTLTPHHTNINFDETNPNFWRYSAELPSTNPFPKPIETHSPSN